MKMVTWNTQWCRGLDGLVRPQRIVEGARAMGDFDVLCLQEIAQGYASMPGAPGDQPAELQALLPGFRIFFGAAVDEFDAQGRRQRFGNLIATRLPVAQVQHHALPWPADGGVCSMPRMCTVVTLRDPALGAVRVMTTHLEYYSKPQRMAQAQALRALHAEACAQAAAPPQADDSCSPFQAKPHTPHAILCGDFNLAPSEPEYTAIQRPLGPARLQDAWPLVHGTAPHAPTFRLFDRSHGPEPMACDFVFVSDTLAPRVQRIDVDLQTRASDHQPVSIEL
ncbi:endonuclease/exonuclease/phosphatase family protein [Variovorax fucosicus]|uniref:endonuclease/exonuclease/phosphatase family protein n=1 Tax=Variovorax fucosicus TaxID=3053517 RepID=UPI002575D08A|nr:endonuclease/exonuclease/phosphatase family protein [Variovorax sp. J22G47]MDM0056968.1 endonuclease/exonuclease/phosphatase family protein [Variovorax sp. J22G47]